MNAFILDHETHNVNKTIRVLGKRKDCKACQFYGLYHADKGYCQVYIETEMSEYELDNWLWSTMSVGDYVGLVETDLLDLCGTATFMPEN